MIDNNLYETTITNIKWIVYDIPGNIGWISYFIGLTLCFVKKPNFMQDEIITKIVLISVIPAILMLVGIVELVTERICRLDRILPQKRLLRGFGALTLGGIIGVLISILAISYSMLIVSAGEIIYLIIMFVGATLCAVFAGLLYKGYHRI